MRVLLDTCTFLWLIGGQQKIGPSAAACLAESGTERLVSYASIWEIGIKVSLGKLRLGGSIEGIVSEYETEGTLAFLPIEKAHIYRSSSLPRIHGDPFDRMIVAQALELGVPLITADSRLVEYGVQVIWR